MLLATLLLSQGTPMLLAGDELGHSQRGNNNAYCQDNDTTWLDWDRADAGLAAFVARLLALRREARAAAPRPTGGRPRRRAGAAALRWLTPEGRAMTPQPIGSAATGMRWRSCSSPPSPPRAGWCW